MKTTSTDEGIKPERVYKMDGKEGDEKKSPLAGALMMSFLPRETDVNVCSPTSRNLVCV